MKRFQPTTVRRIYFAVIGLSVLILIFVGIYYSTNVAVSFALVATSIGLIFATFRLKSATDNLVLATENVARNQILPQLSRTKHVWNEEAGVLKFWIKNTGIGTAYNVTALGFTPNGVQSSIEPEEKLADLLAGETWTYYQNLDTRAFREFKVEFTYADGKDNPYNRTIIIPK